MACAARYSFQIVDDTIGGVSGNLGDMVADLVGDGSGQFLLDLCLAFCRFQFVGDDREDAIAQVPNVFRNQHEAYATCDHRYEPGQNAAHKALTETTGHIADLAAHDENSCARDPACRLIENATRSDVAARGLCADFELFAGGAGDDARNRRPVARPQERFHAFNRRPGCIGRREFDATADSATDTGGEIFYRRLYRWRAVDPLGQSDRQLPGLVLTAQRF